MPAKDAPRIQWLVEPKYDQDGVQATAGIDHLGREHGDPVPLRPPLDLRVSDGDELHTAIRNIFLKERAAFAAAVEAEQFETEEEANDFETGDDIFPVGNEPWEDVFEFPVDPGGVNSPELAAGGVKGGAAGEAVPPTSVSQKSSLGSSSASSSSATTAEKLIGGSVGDSSKAGV